MASVELFDEKNWATGERLREAAGYFGTTTIVAIEDGFRVRFGSPDSGGAVRDFALLAEAIAWANTDAGGVHLLADDDGEITAIEVFDDPTTRRADAELGPALVIDVSSTPQIEGDRS